LGKGIQSEEINKIFDPLFRGQNVSSEITGHGLGLTIALKIAEMHNASISLDSELNVGTNVQVRLPGKIE
jgi:signal transduction histidine kinase